jgi:hypothetical protein
MDDNPGRGGAEGAEPGPRAREVTRVAQRITARYKSLGIRSGDMMGTTEEVADAVLEPADVVEQALRGLLAAGQVTLYREHRWGWRPSDRQIEDWVREDLVRMEALQPFDSAALADDLHVPVARLEAVLGRLSLTGRVVRAPNGVWFSGYDPENGLDTRPHYAPWTRWWTTMVRAPDNPYRARARTRHMAGVFALERVIEDAIQAVGAGTQVELALPRDALREAIRSCLRPTEDTASLRRLAELQIEVEHGHREQAFEELWWEILWVLDELAAKRAAPRPNLAHVKDKILARSARLEIGPDEEIGTLGHVARAVGESLELVEMALRELLAAGQITIHPEHRWAMPPSDEQIAGWLRAEARDMYPYAPFDLADLVAYCLVPEHRIETALRALAETGEAVWTPDGGWLAAPPPNARLAPVNAWYALMMRRSKATYVRMGTRRSIVNWDALHDVRTAIEDGLPGWPSANRSPDWRAALITAIRSCTEPAGETALLVRLVLLQIELEDRRGSAARARFWREVVRIRQEAIGEPPPDDSGGVPEGPNSGAGGGGSQSSSRTAGGSAAAPDASAGPAQGGPGAASARADPAGQPDAPGGTVVRQFAGPRVGGRPDPTVAPRATGLGGQPLAPPVPAAGPALGAGGTTSTDQPASPPPGTAAPVGSPVVAQHGAAALPGAAETATPSPVAAEPATPQPVAPGARAATHPAAAHPAPTSAVGSAHSLSRPASSPAVAAMSAPGVQAPAPAAGATVSALAPEASAGPPADAHGSAWPEASAWHAQAPAQAVQPVANTGPTPAQPVPTGQSPEWPGGPAWVVPQPSHQPGPRHHAGAGESSQPGERARGVSGSPATSRQTPAAGARWPHGQGWSHVGPAPAQQRGILPAPVQRDPALSPAPQTAAGPQGPHGSNADPSLRGGDAAARPGPANQSPESGADPSRPEPPGQAPAPGQNGPQPGSESSPDPTSPGPPGGIPRP